jgi:peptide deformylase
LPCGKWSVPQELFGTVALHELIEVMRATFAAKGVGLAVPQTAVSLRLSVVEDTQASDEPLTPE